MLTDTALHGIIILRYQTHGYKTTLTTLMQHEQSRVCRKQKKVILLFTLLTFKPKTRK